MNHIFVLKKIIPFFVLVLLLFSSSCASRKDVVYYQNIADIEKADVAANFEIKIQPDDLLSIAVLAEDPEITIPFNLSASNAKSTASTSVSSTSGSVYLVDAKGFIEFPVLGALKVSGLTRSELLKALRDRISVYIKNPTINLRLVNFKVVVQGEVTAPGVYPVNSERITLIEALTMASDLTIYGKRDNILIIREVAGVKTYNRVDITKADFINTPFYYLAQNDVVYVEPNNTKIRGSKIGADTNLILSAVSILMTLITLTISITK